MNFDHKLNTLMHLYKISNSKLAKGIGVDASLVSRWKSGERKISPNSPHIPLLASYFLKLNAYQYQREYLDQIISAHLPEGQVIDDASRVHILADWLVSDDPPGPQPDEQPEKLAQSVSLIDSIAEILTGSGQTTILSLPADTLQTDLMPEANWQPDSQSGRRQTYESFDGRSGRRQAVLNLLFESLQADEPLDIYMTNEDDMRWLTEDQSFNSLWGSLLQQIINKGHQITVIHIFTRRINEIMSMLAFWLPLHMAGRINSVYYPRYGDRRIRQSFFIVRSRTAIVTSTIADSSANHLTFRFDDDDAVEQHLRIFKAHLHHCKPLFIVFNPENAKSFFDYCLENNRKNGPVFNIRHQLNFRLMPDNILKTHLEKAPSGYYDPAAVKWQEDERQMFLEKLENDPYIDIIPLTLLEQICSSSVSSLNGCEICSRRPLILNEADTITWLKSTIDILRRYPNYELYLTQENSAIGRLHVNISFKENVSARFSPVGPESQNTASIVLNESNVLHSLSYFFEDFIHQIPDRFRNRQEVILRLERLIASLSGEPIHSI